MMEFQDEKTCQDYRDEIADLKDTLYVANRRIESLQAVLIEIANSYANHCQGCKEVVSTTVYAREPELRKGNVEAIDLANKAVKEG